MGFIDIHTHGAIGIDINTATEEDLIKLSDFYEQHGVSGWLPTIMTDSENNMFKAVKVVANTMKVQKSGAKILGIHLEGPFLNPVFAGAMPPSYLKEGDCKFIEKCQELSDGNIRKITIAPEIKGCLEVIRNFSDCISMSLGHSNATYKESMAAINSGANCITHTCNAMRLFHMHEPGLLGAAFDSDVFCELIADGLHITPEAVHVLYRIKGPEKIVIVTDSMSATGMGDGFFSLGGDNKVVVKGWDCRLVENNVRAGSVLTMDKAFENILEYTGRTEKEILPMFSENQMKVLKIK